jgi:hypothetical protein
MTAREEREKQSGQAFLMRRLSNPLDVIFKVLVGCTARHGTAIRSCNSSSMEQCEVCLNHS